jgi:hypothetical protein
MKGIDPDTGNWVGAGPLSAEEEAAFERNEDAAAAAEAYVLEEEAAHAKIALEEVLLEVDSLLADLRERLIFKGMYERGFDWVLRDRY